MILNLSFEYSIVSRDKFSILSDSDINVYNIYIGYLWSKKTKAII